MDKRELRIGNKLQKETGEIFTVSRLDKTSDILVDEQRGLLTLDYNLFGITLTEEWLLKFGFKSNYPIASREYLKDQNILMVNHYENGWLFICDWWKVGKFIYYVHQLQNLYFALTGDELQLKETEQ